MSVVTRKIKYILIIVSFAAGIIGYTLYNDSKDHPSAEAAVSANVTGFAWSQNIGWISFNSSNCDIDMDGIYEGAGETGGPAPAGCQTSGAVASYGVGVDLDSLSPTYEQLSGYAWGENIGWITFNKAAAGALPPGAPYNGAETYMAKIDMISNKFSGWARALSYGGGWDGWIKLRRDPDYGVRLDGTELKGWAWGGSILGWISFNCSNSGVCGSIDYKVHLQNVPPAISALTLGVPANFCNKPLNYNFGWTFVDPGDTESKYRLQVTTDPTFTDNGQVRVDKTVVAPPVIPNPTDVPILLSRLAGVNELQYNKTYYWRVMVWDSSGLPSAWSSFVGSFTTPTHEYPDVGFTPPDPSAFLVNTQIDFKATLNPNPLNKPYYNSACYKASDNSPENCKSWIWTFDGVSEPQINGPSGDTTHSFPLSGSHIIVLTVEDNDGKTCSNPAGSKSLGSLQTRWVEVVPNN